MTERRVDCVKYVGGKGVKEHDACADQLKAREGKRRGRAGRRDC